MRTAVAILLAAALAGLASCSDRQACYAPEEQPEFGWQLRLVPCDESVSNGTG